ncbi:MAG: hypothetical protein ACOCZS_03205 [Verrucomicrobiota bacterium]
MAIEEEKLNFAINMAENIIDKLGIPAEITGREQNDKIVLDISTSEPGRLIGRKGRSLWYLEYLLNRLAGHGLENPPPVVVDVDGYRRSDEKSEAKKPEKETVKDSPKTTGKNEKLQQFAIDAAKEVKRWGETKTIGPYDPEDYQNIVDVLEKQSGIFVESKTESEGDQTKQKITIRAVDE